MKIFQIKIIKKISPIIPTALLLAAAALYLGCPADITKASITGGATNFIDPYSKDMKKCAPDLSSLGFDQWKNGDNGWSASAQYGILNKHFNPESGTESIFFNVQKVDHFIENEINGNHSDEVTEVSGKVKLPTILGGTELDGFQYRIKKDEGDKIVTSYWAVTKNTDKILSYMDMKEDSEGGNVLYGIRNNETGELTIKTATFLDRFRCIVHFEGNFKQNNGTMVIKTDASGGWCVYGGGSIANESDKFCLRAVERGDSQNYANDGANLSDDSSSIYYAIFTFGDIKNKSDSVAGYPKAATQANIQAETDPAINYIVFGKPECPLDSVAEWKAIKYPESEDELKIE
jgi:hypothetical protein